MDNYSNMDYYGEFKNYATKHLGVSGMQWMAWDKLQTTLYSNAQVSNYLTPMVLEEREMRVTQMSVFDRMMMERILWVCGVVNEHMSTVVQAQLMFLDSVEKKDITLQLDTPGGSVVAGLSMIDVMNYVSSDIKTINMGMAASMGSVLLGAGTKGKRFSLPHSRVMVHQVSSGYNGGLVDLRISLQETEKANKELFKLLGSYCGKDPEQVIKDADRDLWMSSEEAKTYGLVDYVITNKN
jgi:ATP-dependent Clp protease protease subunit